MLRFVSAAVLAASAFAAQLKAYNSDKKVATKVKKESDDVEFDYATADELVEEGRTLERLERFFDIIDTNNDGLIDVTELADLTFLHEDMGYTDFD